MNEIFKKDLNLVKKNFKKRKLNFNLKIFSNLKKKKNFLNKNINFIKIFKKSNLKKKKKYYINKILIIKNNFLKNINFLINKILIKSPNLIHYTTDFIKNFKIIKKKNFYKNKKNIINHLEISKKLGLDIKIGEKISGNGFCLIKNPISSIYRALINLMLYIHKKENNYKEILIPYIVKQKILIKSGYLPKFKNNLFEINFYKKKYLIPTSEVVLININKNFKKNIPFKILSYSNCFRNENKSYGKKNKGLIKQKQFEKIELINFTDNKNSFKYLNELLKSSEKILNYLKINYRIILIKNKNTGITSSKTYDIEVYIPSIKNYLEVSSCSNTKNFQSKKINIKYDNKNNKYVNIINGTGLSIGRVLIAILENNQKKNKILIPKILRKFLNNKKYINYK